MREPTKVNVLVVQPIDPMFFASRQFDVADMRKIGQLSVVYQRDHFIGRKQGT